MGSSQIEEKQFNIENGEIFRSLTLKNINPARDFLADAVAKDNICRFDCSGIEEIDFSGIQIIAIAARSFESRGGSFYLKECPALVRAAFERAGLPLPVCV